MNLHVSLARTRPLCSPSWPLSEQGVGGLLLVRRPACQGGEGLGGTLSVFPAPPPPPPVGAHGRLGRARRLGRWG